MKLHPREETNWESEASLKRCIEKERRGRIHVMRSCHTEIAVFNGTRTNAVAFAQIYNTKMHTLTHSNAHKSEKRRKDHEGMNNGEARYFLELFQKPLYVVVPPNLIQQQHHPLSILHAFILSYKLFFSDLFPFSPILTRSTVQHFNFVYMHCCAILQFSVALALVVD